MNDLVKTDAQEIMEAVLIKGDLSKLTPQERNSYYSQTCQSLGLNPLTRPFDYITLNGKMQLYAKRDAADQLRKLNGVNIEILDRSVDGQLFLVTVRATDKHGRQDEDMGVVTLPQGSGEVRANAMLKAITKAKRRVTLSICGLGFLDETEVEDIPFEAKGGRRAAPIRTIKPTEPPMAIQEKALIESPSTATAAPKSPQSDASPGAAELSDAMKLADDSLAAASRKGMVALKDAWTNLDADERALLRARLDTVHKPAAEFVDGKEGA